MSPRTRLRSRRTERRRVHGRQQRLLADRSADANRIWLAASDGSWHKQLTFGQKERRAPVRRTRPNRCCVLLRRKTDRLRALPSAVETMNIFKRSWSSMFRARRKLTPGVYQMMPRCRRTACTMFAYPRSGDCNQGNRCSSRRPPAVRRTVDEQVSIETSSSRNGCRTRRRAARRDEARQRPLAAVGGWRPGPAPRPGRELDQRR